MGKYLDLDGVSTLISLNKQYNDNKFGLKTDVELIQEDLYGKIYNLDVGDAVLVNKETLEKISVNPDNLSKYSPDEWEPIGVVVIPASHDVYGTGEAGVMSLLSASLDTPDKGQSSNITMAWGAYDTDYPELTNFTHVPSLSVMYGLVQNFITDTKLCGYMPMMRTGISAVYDCRHDSYAKYYAPFTISYGYIPSPYLNDDSRNPDYYSTESPSSVYNALSDFAGKSNTEFLCSMSTSQPNWKTDTMLINKLWESAHPAACACWRFHTIGTNQGDWYLPACGEFGYICPRYDKITETISTIQTYFGNNLCSLSTNPFWTSSNYSSRSARRFDLDHGALDNYDRSGGCYVRPFIRLKIEKNSKYYTKSEVDKLIQNIDVTSQLEEKITPITEEEIDAIFE